MTQQGRGKAYIVGGGIAALSAAVLLIRDAGLPGSNIHILEELPLAGGALDGSGDAVRGYVSRGGRMLTEETYVCLWDVLDGIPSLRKPGMSVKRELWDFNRVWRSEAHARLIDRNHCILDAADLGFSMTDRAELIRLLTSSEHALGIKRIDQCFSAHFFDTNFWALWRTTFAFQNWHSAAELRRYMLRFLQEFPRIHTLGGVRRSPLSQYDSIVRPMQRWLEERGVVFEYGVRIVDADFDGAAAFRRITRLHARRGGHSLDYGVGPDDIALITIGSMTADATLGDDHHAPELVRDPRDGAWTLWCNLARKAEGLGRPQVFCGEVDRTKWESFTLTMRSPVLVERIERYSGNSPGTGGLMTFKDSGWLMSIVVPRPPHFEGQPDGVYTLWGYGLFVDQPGDYLRKPMAQCSGQEILTELVHQLGFEDILEEVRRTTTVIPVMMPYITSEFQCRAEGDRPAVIPPGAENFAFLGQYVEIPQDVVFTVEYSVRTAMHAVYGLLGIEKEIPAIFHGISDPRTVLAGLKTLAA
ncbi:MAG TPA: oleate hydratase [Nevskia sp.]|nr:oleate hydratase [Nevskia sp.]